MYQKLQVGRARAITPSDTNDILNPGGSAAVTPQSPRALGCVLYIGVALTTLKVETIGGDEVTFKAVPAGSFLPVQVKKVFATGTVGDATIVSGDILALW